jgi:hypothetical protein
MLREPSNDSTDEDSHGLSRSTEAINNSVQVWSRKKFPKNLHKKWHKIFWMSFICNFTGERGIKQSTEGYYNDMKQEDCQVTERNLCPKKNQHFFSLEQVIIYSEWENLIA